MNERAQSVGVAWVATAVGTLVLWLVLTGLAKVCLFVSGVAGISFSFLGALLLVAAVYYFTRSKLAVLVAFGVAALVVIGFALGGGIFAFLAGLLSLAGTWPGILILGALTGLAAWKRPDWYKA